VSRQTTISIPLPRIAGAFVPYTAFVLVLALLFGGGTQAGLWSDVIVELAALPLIPWAIVRLPPARLGWQARWAIGLMCAVMALPLLQLVPLPHAVWSAIPGRAEISAAYREAGMDWPWLPVSLDPAATWRSFVSLLPAAAIFLAALSLAGAARHMLVALIVAAACISVPLDFLQIMGGPESPLRFYAVTNNARAVGFFANANHYVALLYCAIPFMVALALDAAGEYRRRRGFIIALLVVSLGAMVIGIALAVSRAGLILGMLAGCGALAIAWRQNGARSGRRLWLTSTAGLLAALLVLFQFGFVNLSERIDVTVNLEDLRWPVARVTARAALAHMPLGSGLGTFVPIYDMYAPRTLLADRFVNHAHDDWLELWLTGGVPALVLAAAFLAWFLSAAVTCWRRARPNMPARGILLARAASIAVALLLVHSALDYPLRTLALSVVFALACALFIPAGEAALTPSDKPERAER